MHPDGHARAAPTLDSPLIFAGPKPEPYLMSGESLKVAAHEVTGLLFFAFSGPKSANWPQNCAF
jgi:hypothetical protein